MKWHSAMQQALAEARTASQHDDVPIGAVVLDRAGKVIAAAGNERELSKDPTAHAEIVAIRLAAAALGTWQLTDCTLICTLEPCTMCAGAIVQSRIAELVFGAWDEKAGAVSSLWDVVRDPRLNHQVKVTFGVCAEESTELLRAFFAERRSTNS